ncbi:hypothetical protein DTO96_101324 [Ephemeroptericola cinctiostellae]|uniref:DSBA-like thioredoxin domain-containing protein n=1 Tax=Ephemeroptericola cinctiostellae TaxID=2268024 RepID=A0A345DB55_9BURK|nr:DsbA family protein [Ephemeroptericola cinctiostellae]AXF85593.1 hypothetical protein DTO96_101324 [Ephemeroptericola cinctiostellae]
MENTTLHYIYDPLCGWCYAATPLISAARTLDGLTIQAHAGGMWTGANVKRFTPELRAMVVPGDQRISELSGQPLGEAYLNQLIFDDTARLDSEPVIRAILTAEHIAQRGLDMHRALQIAHWVQGRHISRDDVLVEIAGEMGLDVIEFDRIYKITQATAHIENTRKLMARLNVQGFPSLILEQNGQFKRIDHGGFYGHADEFKARLASLLV